MSRCELIGLCFVLAPLLVGLFIYIAKDGGIKAALAVFGIGAGLLGYIFIAGYLIDGACK